MKTIITLLIALFALTGCETAQIKYYESEAKRHEAAAERWKALGKVGSENDAPEGTRTMAAVMLGMGDRDGGSSGATMAPKSALDYFMQALGIALPVAGQAYTVRSQTQLGMRQSDNSMLLGRSTNEAFTAIAGKIQSPSANITNNTTLSGTGVLGNGTYSTTANPVTTTTNTTTTDSHENQNNPVTTYPITGK